MEKDRKLNGLLVAIVSLLMGIFIVIAGVMIIPAPAFKKQMLFPIMVVFSIVYFLLGITLIFLTLRKKVEKGLKKFLILTGASSAGFLVSVLLHNFLYALAVITSHIKGLHYLFEVLHAAFFIAGIFICPIGFLVGVVGSIVFLLKKRKKSA